MKTIYCLTAESLSNLGGPMGSDDSTPVIFREYYTAMDFAADRADKHFEKPIKWKKEDGGFTSGDLRWVQYYIYPIKIEK